MWFQPFQCKIYMIYACIGVCSTFEHTHLRISDQPDPLVLGVKTAFWFIGDEYMYNAGWLLEIRTDLDACRVILSIHNCDS
jgi:hypothetical protein